MPTSPKTSPREADEVIREHEPYNVAYTWYDVPKFKAHMSEEEQNARLASAGYTVDDIAELLKLVQRMLKEHPNLADNCSE